MRSRKQAVYILLGILVISIIIVALVFAIIGSASTPDKTLKGYLMSIDDGDSEEAATYWLPGQYSGTEMMEVDRLISHSARVTNIDIDVIETEDDTAWVSVSYDIQFEENGRLSTYHEILMATLNKLDEEWLIAEISRMS